MTDLAQSRLTTLWISPGERAPATSPTPRTTGFDGIGRVVFWPLSVMLIIHRILILSVNGSVTDDFSTVYYALRRFHEGVPIYNEVYHYVDPHYLYSPGATLVLSPLGMLTDFDSARMWFICINAGAIVAGLAVLTRMFGYALSSVVFPGAVFFTFLTEAVRNTLVFSNINGILLLALAAYLYCLLHEHRWAAGILIGMAILIKPIFAPLLFLPLVKLNWRTVAIGVLLPAIINAIAWPIVPGATDYITRTMPYLGEVRDYANSSLPGIATYYGMPWWQEKFWFLFFAGCVTVGTFVLLRWRYSDPLLWLTTTSGLLLAGVFLLSSLGQMYYSMLLFPLLFTVLLRRSPMHSPVAWIAVYCFLSADVWFSDEWIDAGRAIHYLKPTIGWALIVLTISVASVIWWWQERNGRAAVASEPPGTTVPSPTTTDSAHHPREESEAQER
ncbi:MULTISPECIES: glycosyltransferase family 87 protein [unclassified Corynebacterium]|uniref:glycosyltransferase family 87 protein n=1 Tax=unclassified Corynebacterium TaxID=2624378 RepID=UPI003523B56E